MFFQSENPPVCLSHPCGPLPNATNGEWQCYHEKGVEGEVCVLSCQDFYDPESSNVTVCAASTWHPDPNLMACITCKIPSSIPNGEWKCQDFDDIPEYNYTARACALHCDFGYTHSGNNVTMCSLTGMNTWSPGPELAICEEIDPVCEAPPDAIPPHGHWECDEGLGSCSIGCEKGFALNEEVEAECGLTGWCSQDWGIGCQPACQDLPTLVENGTWSCENDVSPYVECILSCHNGTRMIGDGFVWCGLGQSWTGEDDDCTGI